MLRISADQAELFRGVAWNVFVDELCVHLQKFAPEHCRVLGLGRLKGAVEVGLARAGRYGFTFRGPLRFYCELMFLWGSEFDTDPQFPEWARDVLVGGGPEDQMVRAKLLHRELDRFYVQVVGNDRQHARASLARIQAFARSPLPFGEDEFASGLLLAMQTLYPEKFAYLGAAAHGALIDEAGVVAAEVGIHALRGRTTVALLMSTIGHAALRDPLYPWVGVALRGNVPPEKRGERLLRRVMIYLERTLDNLEGKHG